MDSLSSLTINLELCKLYHYYTKLRIRVLRINLEILITAKNVKNIFKMISFNIFRE